MGHSTIERKTDNNGKDLKGIDQNMICKILKLFFFIFDDIIHLTKQFGLCILVVYWWPAVKLLFTITAELSIAKIGKI